MRYYSSCVQSELNQLISSAVPRVYHSILASFSYYLLVAIAVQCPQPNEIQHGTKLGNGRGYNDVITYECWPERQPVTNDQYRLTDGETAKSIICQQNETWSDVVVSCERT